jgi:hypothetical protein
LEVKRDPSGAAADVEDATAREPHRAPVVRRPAAEGRQVQLRPERARVDEAVLAFDDLDCIAPVEGGEDQLAVCIGVLGTRTIRGA